MEDKFIKIIKIEIQHTGKSKSAQDTELCMTASKFNNLGSLRIFPTFSPALQKCDIL